MNGSPASPASALLEAPPPDSPAPPPPSAPPEKRTWKTGTLVYTPAALAALFFWLLWGDFAWSMRDRSAGPMAQWYLNHLKIPSLVFGLLISSFPALIGLILGPIVSMKSDRHRGRFGRRIPFLLVTTPLAALGMVGLGLTPLVARWLHGLFPQQSEMVIALACFAVCWAAFEFATIASQAVFGGLINDVVPTEMLGRFYGIFRAVALLDGIIFNSLLMGRVPTYYTLIFISIGIFYGMAFMWVCFKVKEGEYPPPPPADPVKRPLPERFARGTRVYFRECFSNPYYLGVFFMLMAAFLSFSPVNTFSIPYANSLGMNMELYGKCMALTFAISLGLSFFLGWLADLFHPLRTAMVALAGYALVTAWGGLFAVNEQTFIVALILHGVLSGCYYTSAASMGQRLFPKVKFAQFASAAGICVSLGSIALGPLVGSAIDMTGKFYRITFMFGCGLSLLALAAAWFVYGRFLKLGGPKGYVAPD